MGASHSMEQPVTRPSCDIGLKRREVKALMQCWAVIEMDLRNQSIKLFVRLLRKHPEYRRYFQTVADPSQPVLTRVAADARVQSHFRTIMTSIGSLITTAANNPNNLTPKFDFLALVHRNLGFGLQDFFNFRDELIEYFQTEFPRLMTPLCVGAWHTFLSRTFTEISDRITEHHRSETERGSQREDALQDDNTSSLVIVKHVASKFEAPGELLYWEHRKPFWKTQLELWGEMSDDDDVGEDEDEVLEEVVTNEPEPRETRRRHRWRRMWHRFSKRCKRFYHRW